MQREFHLIPGSQHGASKELWDAIGHFIKTEGSKEERALWKLYGSMASGMPVPTRRKDKKLLKEKISRLLRENEGEWLRFLGSHQNDHLSWWKMGVRTSREFCSSEFHKEFWSYQNLSPFRRCYLFFIDGHGNEFAKVSPELFYAFIEEAAQSGVEVRSGGHYALVVPKQKNGRARVFEL